MSGAKINIREVVDRKTIRDFLDVPFTVYAGDEHWVAPLRHIERRRISPRRKHPFYEHGVGRFWVAYRDNKPVGRIGAVINHLHLKHHDDSTGHFSMLEAVDDPTLFEGLLKTAEGWARTQGMERLTGPFNLSINEECGLLVEGFDIRPAFGLGHARPYYQCRLAALGYGKEKDLLSYVSFGMMTGLDRNLSRMETAAAEAGFQFRHSSRKHLTRDIHNLITLFNDAWAGNWGFVPITQREANQLVKDLRTIIYPKGLGIAERNGEVVAMACTIPDINEVLHRLRGRLLPFGWLRLLWHLKIKPLSTHHLPLAGVRRSLQDTAAGAIAQAVVFYTATAVGRSRPVTRVEAGWILEDNRGTIRFAETAGMTPHKRYRIFGKDIGDPSPF